MDSWTVALLFVVLAAGALVWAAASAPRRPDRQTQVRLATIERKIDVLLRHLNITEPVPDDPDIVACLERGARIQAVKLYRERKGVSLTEAKNAVDLIARERGLRP